MCEHQQINYCSNLHVHQTIVVLCCIGLQTAGLTSQPTSQTYASITSQGVEATSGHSPPGSHGSHMSSPTESHDHQQRQLYTEEDEDDKPPSAHTVNS